MNCGLVKNPHKNMLNILALVKEALSILETDSHSPCIFHNFTHYVELNSHLPLTAPKDV